jgi:hypothetical protein
MKAIETDKMLLFHSTTTLSEECSRKPHRLKMSVKRPRNESEICKNVIFGTQPKFPRTPLAFF